MKFYVAENGLTAKGLYRKLTKAKGCFGDYWHILSQTYEGRRYCGHLPVWWIASFGHFKEDEIEEAAEAFGYAVENDAVFYYG